MSVRFLDMSNLGRVRVEGKGSTEGCKLGTVRNEHTQMTTHFVSYVEPYS